MEIPLEKNNDNFKVYMNFDNTKGEDYDLNLKMKSINGTECKIDYLNNQCPYASKIKDVTVGEKGYEVIEIEQFTNAQYMVYVSKTPNYTGTCTELSRLPVTRRLEKQISISKNKFRMLIEQDYEVYYTVDSGKTNMSQYQNHAVQTIPNFKPIKMGAKRVVINLV